MNDAIELINLTRNSYNPKLTGKGITVAILDTGLYPMADFTVPSNRIKCFVDFINNRQEPYDDNGHGTHVAVLKS